MKPEYFLMIILAAGVVGIVITHIGYRREKASLDETPDGKKDNDWSYFGIGMLVIVFVMCGWIYIGYLQDKRNQRPIEENLRTEEFSYKGHQYIKFETNRTFDGISVVHDPNCECQLKKDSTNI